ncbi:TRAP transporter small permease [Stappia stellulata]|uniref:TRAP transporter small permease n=1 Tax=Stappia stellulata TaxID=71235 RepID=UPI001CD63E66|nr:TRAP transporter small permease [Stappia stellulata]MCA1243314.1 TRAP transporter small permease [Stappia stellulata]
MRKEPGPGARTPEATPGFWERAERLLARGIKAVSIAAGLSIVAMMLQVTADVALRYLTGTGLPGTLTIVSYYYMVIVAFVPLAFAELQRAHIQMELVTDLLPRRLSRQIGGWGLLFTGLVTGALTVRGFEEALNQMRIGASQVQGTTSIDTWPAHFALPLGAGLMTLLVALRFLQFLAGCLPRSAAARDARGV